DMLGREILPLPVRVGSPTSINGISDVLRDPAYATSVGLLIWGAKHEGASSGKSNKVVGDIRRLVFRIRSLFR
ncbi:MAG: cell division protein FtsA, partial [Dehalococcoidales bacterium]|nr:cell division protein FtsA [Dehalococcoidales bacterium]